MNINIPFEEIPFHLGLKSTDILFVSSDLKTLALHAKNKQQSLNIDLFIGNLQSILDEGTLIFPAYTDYLKSGDFFDWEKGKPSTVALSNKIFKRKDFTRTRDPLHSVFVWGKDSEELLSLFDNSTFGENSVFGFLDRKNARFLFIDVHIENSFTFIHYVEEYKRVLYRKYFVLDFETISEKNQRMTIKTLFHTRKKGVVTDFSLLQNRFDETGAMKHLFFNDVPFDLIDARDAVLITEKLLDEKKYLYRFDFSFYLKQVIKELFPFLLFIKHKLKK
jgi:aminoglycoside 3-N-acetyltransferase